VWATIAEVTKAHKEAEKAYRKSIEELTKVHRETEKALKEAQRIVGDLGNRFGDPAERSIGPGGHAGLIGARGGRRPASASAALRHRFPQRAGNADCFFRVQGKHPGFSFPPGQ
jgi:hypothetical protein